jgi:lambda family phage minor tail protein L
MIDKLTAQSALKLLNAEAFSLAPSALITMFEIDITDIAFDQGLDLQEDEKIFRFHNSINVYKTEIIWKGNTYYPMPIIAEGFELNGKGVLPTPRLTLSVNETAIPALASLKEQLRKLGDLIGAKLTRIRTFAKFLDASNFPTLPPGYEPNPAVEFPRDIYYIDRKSNENRNVIEYELASILDLEGLQLPGRLILAERCVWTYRGPGCLYEYAVNKTSAHGLDPELPVSAPPVATVNDEKITDILQVSSLRYRGKYSFNSLSSYAKGDFVYIEKNGIKYYFVAKKSSPSAAPPSSTNWVADICSKTIKGCKKRFPSGVLPFGGFPAAAKVGG